MARHTPNVDADSAPATSGRNDAAAELIPRTATCADVEGPVERAWRGRPAARDAYQYTDNLRERRAFDGVLTFPQSTVIWNRAATP
jgi:hypothetical protein